MEIKLKVQMIMMPNHLTVQQPIGKKEDGFKSLTIPISELTELEANEYAEEMKQEFLKHYKIKKQIQNNVKSN